MRRFGCLLLLILFFIAPIMTISVSGESDLYTPLSSFQYNTDEESRTVTLTKYIGADPGVTVPGSYTIDGISYRVIIDCRNIFFQNTTIVSVSLAEGIRPANNSCAYLFYNCPNLKTADLSGMESSGVTSLRCMFAYCGALETVNLAGTDTACVTDMTGLFSDCRKLSSITGYENWDTGSVNSIYMAFNQTRALKTVDLSRWDLRNVTNSGWCFQYCGAKSIYLPDSLKTISAGFMNHASKYEGTSFTVPAGAEQIGYAHTFYDFGTGSFVEFTVPENNPCYKAIDGILYSADGTELLAIPQSKTFVDGIFQIPEGVAFLGEMCFSRNSNIKTLILPDSLSIHYVGLNDPDYIIFQDDGNLNAGTNLNIAIYCYTGITAYGVKDTNPRYCSRDGILYSKELSAVIAVPSRYDRLIDIPQGVTVWNSDAVWAMTDDTSNDLMKNCPGVSIPASLVSISDDQIRKLNSLKKTFDSFSISVSSENPVYCVDENGDLALRPVPPETTPEETAPPTTPTETSPVETVPPTVPAETTPSTMPPAETAPPETDPTATPSEPSAPQETTPGETLPSETVSPTMPPVETMPQETTPATTPGEAPPPETAPPTTPPMETLPPETAPEQTTPPPAGVTDVMPSETLPTETAPPQPSLPDVTEPSVSATNPPINTEHPIRRSFWNIPLTAVVISAMIRIIIRRRQRKL